MVSYKIEVVRRAKKNLRKIPKIYLERIVIIIQSLEENPWPHGSEKMAATGNESTYRIRVGVYRIMYHVDESLITVVGIGHRRDVYRK